MNVPGLGTRPYWRVPVPLMFKIIHILSTKTAYFEHILDKSKNHGKKVKKNVEKEDFETKKHKFKNPLGKKIATAPRVPELVLDCSTTSW